MFSSSFKMIQNSSQEFLGHVNLQDLNVNLIAKDEQNV
jgi:hypothetical protein